MTPMIGSPKVTVPSSTSGDPGASTWTMWLLTKVPLGIGASPGTGTIAILL